MTYINNKTRLFLDRGDIKLERRRSEARLKTYPSAVDIRAWCGIVEDRRQHILELVNKGRERCLGRLIPIESIIDALLAGRISDTKKLRKCLVQLWEFLEGVNLSEEDKQKLAIMKEQMDPICSGKESGEGDQGDQGNQQHVGLRKLSKKDSKVPSQECVARERHDRELDEVNTLLKSDTEGGGSYKITARGPAKIITRVKGIRPNIKVTPKPEAGPTRPQEATRTENTFSDLDETRFEDFPELPTPLRQSTPRPTPYKSPVGTPREQPLGQSLQNQSKDQSPQDRSIAQSPKGQYTDRTPQGQPLDQSFNRQSPDRTAQGQPRTQSPQMQYIEQTPTGTPQYLDQTVQDQSRTQSPQMQYREQTPKGTPLLNQTAQGQPRTQSPQYREQTPKGTPQHLNQTAQGQPRTQSPQMQYREQTPMGTPQFLNQTAQGQPITQSPQMQYVEQTPRGTPQYLNQTAQDQSRTQSPQMQYVEQTPRGTPQYLNQTAQDQSRTQSPQMQYVEQTPQGTPRGQPLGQSVRRQSLDQTVQDQLVSPKRRSIKGTPQRQPLEYTPKRQSPDQTSYGQSIAQSPQNISMQGTPQEQLLGQSLEQTRISPKRLSYEETQLEQTFGQSYQREPDSQLYQSELEDSVFIRESDEFLPLQNSSMMGESPKLPRMDLDLSTSINPDELRIQLQARETLCNELQNTLENIKIERDTCRKKLESALEELEAVKKLNAASPVIPSSCKEEIEALELEIKVMRSGNLSPEQEAEVIRKEVDVLKKYCMKLKSVEDENEKLKLERDTLKSQVVLSEDKSVKDNLNRQVAGIVGDIDEKHKTEIDNSKGVVEGFNNLDLSKLENPQENLPYIEELKSKLKNLEEITRERDTLANRVQRLEKELLQYRDLPEDIDVYRNRSKMLDSALEERDKMSKKVEQLKEMEDEMNKLKKKSSRVDQLEEELKLFSKNGKNIGSELKKANSRCLCLEKELENVKMERDSMRTRIEYMKKEIDMLRAKSKEAEIYKVERDKLQIRVNELTHIQIQYENLLLKCKCLENAAAEKQMYKQKYEEILTMECQGDMLRSQVEAAKHVERERNSLVKQVGDLESCICDQEEEIKKLVMQIDNLCRNKDDNHCRMREALASMRAEIEKKDCLIAESEEKLAAVQSQLKSSIQGVSCETTCYKTRIEELERELNKAQLQNETLKKQLNKNDNSLKGVEKLTKSECESVATMRHELDTAKEENKKLRDIANKMVSLTGDEHVQNMLKQSQCAVKRVVEELGRQYKEWDNMKRNQKKGIFAQVNKRCPCKYKHVDPRHTSDSENEKLVEELEDIQREKDKLEQIVKQIQNDKFSESPQNELISLRINNAKLHDELKKEIEKRKDLEQKLKISA